VSGPEQPEHQAEDRGHRYDLADPEERAPLDQLNPPSRHLLTQTATCFSHLAAEHGVQVGDLLSQRALDMCELHADTSPFFHRAAFEAFRAPGTNICSPLAVRAIQQLEQRAGSLGAKPLLESRRHRMDIHPKTSCSRPLPTTMPSSTPKNQASTRSMHSFAPEGEEYALNLTTGVV
jgi:hypothetical protein